MALLMRSLPLCSRISSENSTHAELAEEVGLTSKHEPYVKRLQDKLWELRVKGKTGLGRGLSCTVCGRRGLVLRYFLKQFCKTSQKDIAIAHERLCERGDQ
ncbi:MAG: type II toxin-antitoxin system RelE/ParE family toxin [Lachnospiraceae bacterium]|nr:type II toxin-antitoxin system RelE/ParE family toxin [Lachnospiraceae bacterium]